MKRWMVLTVVAFGFAPALFAQDKPLPTVEVVASDDFEVTGKGDSPHWDKTQWFVLNSRSDKQVDYETKVKLLYSSKGLYVLMKGADAKVTATMTEDFANLWTEDVFEVFLWPDERDPIYFEYEISPLGYELPILVPNLGSRFMGWRPWHYEGDRKIRKNTSTSGGPKESAAEIDGWLAEVFIPYALLHPMRNLPPKSGTHWRANFYRMDYDNGMSASWDWSRVGPSFHEYEKYGTLIFK